ncbi:MAG: hypothetical protein U9N59_03180 [Campylobacterota bacterium]|nr:hypothetical protein [Campylobacterota bacterium]
MIAIHHREDSFSDKWIEYCQVNNIKFKLVNCFSTDIMKEIKKCSVLLWHWHHNDYKAQLFARQFLISVEKMGLKVFPDTNTAWHFDDKVGQKYLFEAIDAPLIKSYVFYDLDTTLTWINETSFPKVFKLRGGAGASNVSLLRTKSDAIRQAKRAFGKGFTPSRFEALRERLWHFKRDKDLKSFLNLSRGIGRVFFPNKIKTSLQIEKNYFYAQDFIPNNDSDIRIIVIGKRAFAIKRMVRDGDFRASGSGNIVYEPSQIPKECLSIAFDVSKKLQIQSAAYDFVFLDDKPLIVEISYAFSQAGYLDCPGYWDEKLNWIEGSFTSEFFMIEDLIKCVE